jgi:glycine cleavage system regulatory protein
VQLQVQVDVGLGADALQEALDDLCFHLRCWSL